MIRSGTREIWGFLKGPQSIETRPGTAPSPDVRLVTDEETFLDLAAESLSVEQAEESGRLCLEGTPEAIRSSLEVFAAARRSARIDPHGDDSDGMTLDRAVSWPV